MFTNTLLLSSSLGSFPQYFTQGVQRPQSIQNEQLQEQKQHFLEAQSLVSPEKPKNKDAHINWQIYSPLKRELSCVELYPFPIQPIKGNNYGLIPEIVFKYSMTVKQTNISSNELLIVYKLTHIHYKVR